MTPSNVLVLMSDEHNPKFLGAAGHPFIATPNLDALAARGTRFTSAYTTCPICVPARAAFAVGRYVNEIGYWDNADAYDGAIPSWHHALARRRPPRRLHRQAPFPRIARATTTASREEIVPMHVVEGIGDVKGLVRENIPTRKGGDKMAKRAGPGESSYTAYDRDIAARAQVWLHEEAPKWRDKPWVLFVSFVLPHFPLTAPPHWFYRYWQQDLPLPKRYAKDRAAAASVSSTMYEHTVDYDSHFDSAERRQARGRGLRRPRVGDGRERRTGAAALCATRGSRTPRASIYTSDHGDNAGARGLWGKSTLYEESAGVPLMWPGRTSRPAASSGAGVAHRLRADDPGGGGRAARASAVATCPARRCSTSRKARSRRGP